MTSYPSRHVTTCSAFPFLPFRGKSKKNTKLPAAWLAVAGEARKLAKCQEILQDWPSKRPTFLRLPTLRETQGASALFIRASERLGNRQHKSRSAARGNLALDLKLHHDRKIRAIFSRDHGKLIRAAWQAARI